MEPLIELSPQARSVIRDKAMLLLGKWEPVLRLADVALAGSIHRHAQKAKEQELSALARQWPPERSLLVIASPNLAPRSVIFVYPDRHVELRLSLTLVNLSPFDIKPLKISLDWAASWSDDYRASGRADHHFRADAAISDTLASQSHRQLDLKLSGQVASDAPTTGGALVEATGVLVANGVWGSWEASLPVSSRGVFLPVESRPLTSGPLPRSGSNPHIGEK
jgi:hypothetical protein